MKLIFAVVFAITSAGAFAQEEIEVNDITMNVVSSSDIEFESSGERGKLRDIVTNYMLENGDITQEQLDAARAQRRENYQELKLLRESGDQDALLDLLSELRDERMAIREELKAYIESHDDLAEALKEQREAVREQRRDNGLGPLR
ncbi:MAG: membrane peptidoglycan carboxypeptidase [Zhongshania marina]|jgi:membrane peptidoglycan carboxypeptidase